MILLSLWRPLPSAKTLNYGKFTPKVCELCDLAHYRHFSNDNSSAAVQQDQSFLVEFGNWSMALPSIKKLKIYKLRKHDISLRKHKPCANPNNSTTLTGTTLSGISHSVVSNTDNTPYSGIPDDTSVEAISGVANVSATTKFVDDADTVTRDESMIHHVSEQWLKINDTQVTEQSIIDFLAKPIVLSQGTLASTDTYGFTGNIQMPRAAFTATQGAMWLNKLRGYYGIRMDMRFRIVVNANRFQMGRYNMGWTPLAGCRNDSGNLRTTFLANVRNATLVQRTTLPHVEFDLATETSAELLVPFCSVNSFYPINALLAGSNDEPLGILNIYPYVALTSASGSTTAPYTIYVSFENVRLFGAASSQSGISTREVTHKLDGPISGVAMSFAKGFKEFSNIPLLSSFAKNASWISDRVALCASVFGFSKPTQGDSLGKMAIVTNPNHCHVDGDDDARALSYLSRPATIPLDGLSGSKFDEMDFSYIVRKYAFVSTKNWSTSDAVGTLLTINTTPNQTLSSGGAFHYQPVAFVANLFRLWRGSLKFRIKIVKTEFHSGRLSFSFFPSDEFATYVGEPQYVNRQIVDIRDHNSVELVIPFISRHPWLTSPSSTGRLVVDIVDPLVAPATVPSTIVLITEVCGGDDFEVAIPGGFPLVPSYFIASSGIGPAKHVSMDVGNSEVHANSVAASGHTIGDKVSSFRTLLKRYGQVLPNSKAAASTSRLNDLSLSVVPDAIPFLSNGPPTYYSLCDPTGMVASCYAMWSGGIRLKDVVALTVSDFPSLSQTSNIAVVTADTYGSDVAISSMATTQSSITALYQPPRHQVVHQLTNNQVLTVEVPQYTRTLARNVADLMFMQAASPVSWHNGYTRTASQNNIVFSLPAGLIKDTTPPDGFDLHNLYRALSDDGNFHTFCSIPPMVVYSNSTYEGFY